MIWGESEKCTLRKLNETHPLVRGTEIIQEENVPPHVFTVDMVERWKVNYADSIELSHENTSCEENRDVRKKYSRHSIENHQRILCEVVAHAAAADLKVFRAFVEHRAEEKSFDEEPIGPSKSLHF